MRKYCSSEIIVLVFAQGHNNWVEFGRNVVEGQSCFPGTSLPFFLSSP